MKNRALLSSLIAAPLIVALASGVARAAPWEPPTAADLAQLVQGRDWPIIMAFVVGGITRQLKKDARFPITVPKRLLPFVPAILGLLSGLAEALIKDVPWRAALAGAVVTAVLPMIGHDLAKGALGRDVPLGPLGKKAPPDFAPATPAAPAVPENDVGAETIDEIVAPPIEEGKEP